MSSPGLQWSRTQSAVSRAPVVWVTPFLTSHARSGGDIRSHRILSAVAQQAPTTLVIVGPPVDTRALKDATGVAQVLWFPPCAGVAARLRAVARRWPVAAARAWNREAAALVVQHVEAGARLVCDRFYTAPYGIGRPHILHLHDAESARISSLPRPAGLPAALSHEWARWVLPSFEEAAVRRPGARVVTVSKGDADILGVSASVVPNGTDLQPPRQAPDAGSLLFVGALDYEPNRQAVQWWSQRVWPLLPTGTPPLRVVGRQGGRSIAPLEGLAGVDLVGEVEDMAVELAGAQLSVVPLLHGSGTRLKVLEAMAWSIPVVGTSKAVEGLGLHAGVQVAVADDPGAFAELVTALRSDLPERRRLGAAGRVAAEPFEWRAMGGAFVDVLDQLKAGTGA